jgi:hypothetical protein
VVEARHRREVVLRDAGRVAHRDQAVGVGGIADDEDADVVGGALVDRLALRDEDAAVRLEQVLALHALGAGAGADEQCDVGAVERRVGVGRHDAGEQRERAVVELHAHTLECAERGRDLEQLEDDRLVGSEHLAARDPEQEAVADLAGRTRDGDANGRLVEARHAAEVTRAAAGATNPRAGGGAA